MANAPGLPRASWTNVLASSPFIVIGVQQSGSGSKPVVPLQSISMATGANGDGALAVGPMVYNGSTYNKFDAAANVADAVVGNTFPVAGMMVYNGATFDRSRSANATSNTTGTGLPGSAPMCFDNTNYQRILTGATADGVSYNNAGGTLPSMNLARNRSLGTFQGIGCSASNNIAQTTQADALATAQPGEWSITAAAGAGNQSTVSKAAGAAGVRHVLRSFDFTVTATVAGTVTINIRDGATGAGTILRQYIIAAAAGVTIAWGMSGLNQFGTAATAMTIESAAGVANVSVTVNASGYSTV